jgi:multicomponent Na+:H+ antiporter subunit D
MTKIWAEAFWKEAPEVSGAREAADTISKSGVSAYTLILPTAVLAVITVIIGLAAEPVYRLASRAAEQLMNPAEYIQIVLERRS